jgi:hypothetical protein
VGPSTSVFFRKSMLHGEVPLPLTPELRVPCPLCYMSFFLRGRDQSVQGAMLVFLGGGCGRTVCHLSGPLWVCQAG